MFPPPAASTRAPVVYGMGRTWLDLRTRPQPDDPDQLIQPFSFCVTPHLADNQRTVNAIAQQRTFLTAEWKNLLMLNYAVDPALLQPFVPAGTELDQHDGITYASLIGFEFNKTRLFGRAVPFHQSFEEVNLRFYVRRGTRRGVVFIRELVPKVAVTAIARLAMARTTPACRCRIASSRSGQYSRRNTPGARAQRAAQSPRKFDGR